MTSRSLQSWMKRTVSSRKLVAGVAFLIIAAAAAPADATARLWLYPDSDDPRAGGHVVNGDAFTLNIENVGGGGNGDNTAYEVVLLVAVNDPALMVDATVTLPGGAVTVVPGDLVFGVPTMPCSDATIPPHGRYPSSFVGIPVAEIAAGETVQAGVVVNGSDGLEVHFDATALGARQAGPNVTCYDIVNPPGHDVTLVVGEPGGGACHEVAIAKDAGASSVAIGDVMDYVITVANAGTCELTGVVLTEDLPTVPDAQGQQVPAFTVTAVDPPPSSQTATSIEWVIDTLDVGATVTAVISVVFDQPDAEGLEIENTACVASVELPDPECATATVTVGTVDDDHLGGPGFWCNQLRFARVGSPAAQFALPDLEAWLVDLFAGSAVFPEVWPLISLPDAEALLCRPGQAVTMADRLARHLLALWFNVASGRLPVETVLGDLCTGDQEPPAGFDPTMTVEALIAAAEADILAGADDETLELWKDIIDFVNSSSLPGPGGCDSEEASTRNAGQRRRAVSRP
ncbi:MAG TPA: DUF11 domain-containing protein [Candidatus Sulfomarinibacteraceae bacterium]|nr:DUF11 domain-containing protein [Candidatus Sulfomarinibacteraceae bacterium]